MRQVYHSKLDIWLILLMVICTASAVIFTVQLAQWKELLLVRIGILLMAALVATPLWLILTTRYILNHQAMSIICGPFKWRIPYATIDDIQDTQSLRTSPALSLDRLAIHYGQVHQIVISPRGKQQFKRQLRQLVEDARRRPPIPS